MKREAAITDSNSINLLVSILIRYPQVFAIKYNNIQDSYVFSFMYKGKLESDRYNKLVGKVKEYFAAYTELNKTSILPLKFKKDIFKKCTLIEVTYEGNPFNANDVNLLASIMLLDLGESIISDYEEFLLDYSGAEIEGSELFFNRCKNNLIVFREAGKVYIFDK